MIESPLERRLLSHVVLRLVAATVLLGTALLIQVRAPDLFDLNPFYVLIASAYAVSLVFIATLRVVGRLPWLIDVHFAIDVLVVSAAVALTGGITSIFTSLYVLPIVAASTLQFRRGSLQVAALSSVLYAGVVLAQYAEVAGLIGPVLGYAFDGDLPRANVAQYTVGLNVAGLFAVAFLSGSLAERLRRTDVKLEKTSGELADLQFFNEYIIHNLVSGLATADAAHRVLTFNRSAIQITGHELATVLGRSVSEVLQLPPDFMASLDADLQRARSKRIDVQYQRTDQRFIDLGLSVALDANAERATRVSLYLSGRDRNAPARTRRADSKTPGSRRRDGGRYCARDSQPARGNVRVDADSAAGAIAVQRSGTADGYRFARIRTAQRHDPVVSRICSAATL